MIPTIERDDEEMCQYAQDVAHDALGVLVRALPDDVDNLTVAYNIFIEMVHVLGVGGWNARELCADVRGHMKLAKEEAKRFYDCESCEEDHQVQ